MNWYRFSQSEVMFDSTGTVKVHNDGWIILHVDPELTRYYLSRFNRSHVYTDIQIMLPKWGGHITIVAGDEHESVEDTEENKKTLNMIDGMEIPFSYSPIVTGNENHFWLNVKCESALDIRDSLGLSREPRYPFHLTIGVIMRD